MGRWFVASETGIRWWGRSSARFLELPGIEIHVVFTVVLVAADVKTHLHRVTFGEAIGQRGLLFDALKFDRLGIFPVFDFNDELALGKSAREGLHFTDDLDGPFYLKTLSHIVMILRVLIVSNQRERKRKMRFLLLDEPFRGTFGTIPACCIPLADLGIQGAEVIDPADPEEPRRA